MTRVFLANNHNEERSALRLILLDLKMQVVGEATDWFTTLALAPATEPDMLIVDWAVLPQEPASALQQLRQTCPAALVIVLIGQLDARQQAALSSGADHFISKKDMPDRVIEYLRVAATGTGGGARP